MEFRLGRAIATISPFVRVPKEQATILPKKDIVSNKIIATMVVIAIVNIAVLILCYR